MTHATELHTGKRFAFGENWSRFLDSLDEARIQQAMDSLTEMLGLTSLEGKTFLDAGSGSGLSSLAARKLGAHVRSFDYDPKSVACTIELKRRYYPNDENWLIEEESVLNQRFLSEIGTFDIVYSWGVLHHTGKMFQALENIAPLVKPSGYLFIAIYNYMGGASKRWTWIKRTYCRLPAAFKVPFALAVLAPIQLYSFAAYAFQGKILEFVNGIVNYKTRRGMSWWHDQLDWIGGFPYEDAKPEDIFHFYRSRGFRLERLKTCGGGVGCNEFVFSKEDIQSKI